MKRTACALSLALCLACGLTACAPADPSPKPGPRSPDAVQSYPSRVAASELIFDALPVGFERVSQIGWCDFDRDGAEEEYKVLVQMDEQSGMGTYRVSIGGDVLTGDAFAMDKMPYLVSVDGVHVQLALYDNGMSDDPMLQIFGWDGASAFHAGTVYAEPEDIEFTHGAIIVPERYDVLQNAWFDMYYEFKDHSLVRAEDPEKWYTYTGETNLTTKETIRLFEADELASSASFEVPAGQLVQITGAAIDRQVENPSEGDLPLVWVRLRVEDTGKSGYLLANAYQCRMAGSGLLDPFALFDGLIAVG